MEQRSYRGWLWTLALIGLLLDQTSKYSVFALLGNGFENRQPLIPGAFDLVAHYKQGPNGQLVPHVNHGALFGLAQKWEGSANMVFAVISFFAAILIMVWSLPKSTAHDRSLCISLGLILGGTLGNLYDRLAFGGVRDFLDWYYLYDWPVFNLADCWLVLGAGLLLFQAFRHQPTEEKESEPSSEQVMPRAVSEPEYAAVAASRE